MPKLRRRMQNTQNNRDFPISSRGPERAPPHTQQRSPNQRCGNQRCGTKRRRTEVMASPNIWKAKDAEPRCGIEKPKGDVFQWFVHFCLWGGGIQNALQRLTNQFDSVKVLSLRTLETHHSSFWGVQLLGTRIDIQRLSLCAPCSELMFDC